MSCGDCQKTLFKSADQIAGLCIDCWSKVRVRAAEVNKPTEAEIKREICDFLALHPLCVFTLSPGIQASKGRARSRYMPKGWPDITGVWGNKGLFIEVKTPGGAVSKEQVEILRKLTSLGHLAFVARSVEDVRKELWV